MENGQGYIKRYHTSACPLWDFNNNIIDDHEFIILSDEAEMSNETKVPWWTCLNFKASQVRDLSFWTDFAFRTINMVEVPIRLSKFEEQLSDYPDFETWRRVFSSNHRRWWKMYKSVPMTHWVDLNIIMLQKIYILLGYSELIK